ncbi:MAG: hypothetical protein NT177_07055 [Chloroflexi bacterium]|jgi:hypothetical protein|nr:hypothetical protein [Chloroflexota bacterium]
MKEKKKAANQKENGSESPRYMPTMTQDYSRISDTAKAIDLKILPGIMTYIRSISSRMSHMDPESPFVIADYGAADGVNSSSLFEKIIEEIRAANPSLKIRLLYIDIAIRDYFDQFWVNSKLKRMGRVEAEYIQRSFYEAFPEISRKLNIGFSSTSLHWLNTKDVDTDFFQHPAQIQANQIPDEERRKFVEKWGKDWRVFFGKRAVELVKGGALFLANLTNRGRDRWPASAGYNNLRDICRELCQEGGIKSEELNAIFVPDYFATPDEMQSLIDENKIKKLFDLKSFEEMTVPCAYYSQVKDQLENEQARAKLADTLAHVVRAWSESSIRTGLSPDNKDKIEEIYRRLREKFYETPEGLPYEYCLLELIKK